MIEEITLTQWFDEGFKANMQDKRTSFPAKIVSVDIQSCKCVVQPIHKFKEVQSGEEKLPALIEDVPIIFPRSAGSIDVFPLKKGDVGQCIVSDRSISEWLSGSGTEIFPENPNIMEGSQCSFLPGGYPFAMTFGNSLPENTRSIIVKPGTKLYLGNDIVELVDIVHRILGILQTGVTPTGGPVSWGSPDQPAVLEALLGNILYSG